MFLEPIEHVLNPASEVEAGRIDVGMSEDRLDLRQGQCGVVGHASRSGVSKIMKSPVRPELSIRPLQDRAHGPVGQLPGLTAASSPERVTRRERLTLSEVGGQIAKALRGHGHPCRSRVPFEIT